MNIVTQFPVNINLNIANPQTEAARKEALSRDAITQATENEQSAKESGVGSERERAQARANQPVTYEFIKHERHEQHIEQRHAKDHSEDNPQDDSSDKQATDQNQQQGKQQKGAAGQQLSEGEQQKVDDLEKRDREVRTHEQAHANIGGQYAGSPSYEFERGPDGKNYAVGGEVKIDVSKVQNDPQATIRKMEQVQRAALAPAEPSAADRRVANEAAQKAQQARADLQQEQIEEIQSVSKVAEPTQVDGVAANREINQAEAIATIFGVKDAIPNFEPKQSLNIEETVQPRTEDYDPSVSARALRIQKFYNSTSVPQSTHFTRYA
ncbi:putative metalloprotease CJM1_0395 family protein [Catenovulum sp. SX2]|uniref:putative metalloprotease CJM1_0395 family protein n=1 Tax=Catenovulum sp. SX2 TaxID=3398614 RepID=UPI003F85BD6E